jgi:hypothetical protein
MTEDDVFETVADDLDIEGVPRWRAVPDAMFVGVVGYMLGLVVGLGFLEAVSMVGLSVALSWWNPMAYVAVVATLGFSHLSAVYIAAPLADRIFLTPAERAIKR